MEYLFYWEFNDKDVVFVQSGIGKVNAAITATLLIEKFKVREVIFCWSGWVIG